jgi:hypothetical protein
LKSCEKKIKNYAKFWLKTKVFMSYHILKRAKAKYSCDLMLGRIFKLDSTWYNRDTDRLECDGEMFFGVTTKTTDRHDLLLELGYQPSCAT